ncbi:MAG: flavin reductase [Oscillospiraceae bacterium]|nr:flavin reductase [Oscillospiraceae bacterium]
MAWTKKDPAQLTINPFTLIGKDWFLLSAGTPEDYNTMTCSWGALGELWGEPSVTAYVRSSRHTFGYLEKNGLFTVSVFPEGYRKALAFCGSHSGRDCDKAAETGLEPVGIDGTVTFAQARLVLVCEKVYAQDLSEALMTPEVRGTFYGSDAMHRMYIGRILAAYERT